MLGYSTVPIPETMKILYFPLFIFHAIILRFGLQKLCTIFLACLNNSLNYIWFHVLGEWSTDNNLAVTPMSTAKL
jgi:hypothetical protein